MGVEDRRERERLARREAIISSAHSLFIAKGFTDTTMDEIAHQTELSKGTLYLYFNSKEELYVTVITEGLKILFDRLEETFDRDLTPNETIRQIGRGLYHYYIDYREYFRIFFFLEHRNVSRLLPRYLIQENIETAKRFMGRFADVVRKGVEEGRYGLVDPWKAAAAFWGAINGVLMLLEEEVYQEIIATDIEELVNYTIDHYLDGLTGTGRSNMP
jgi:AcrR family transcriptional regulator